MEPQTVESGVQLFSRISPNTYCLEGINSKLFVNGGPRANQVIEVTGECSNDLLIDFLVRCILPKVYNDNWKGSGAIFVNVEHHISLLRITKVIDRHLKLLNIKDRKAIIEVALKNIVIFNCFNKEQLDITLKNLERFIQDRDNINLLVIDNITSYYWIARRKNVQLSFDSYSNSNFTILKSVTKTLNLTVVFSRHQVGDLSRSLNLHVDYKILGEILENGDHQFVVFNYEKETSVKVPFTMQNCIMCF